MAQRRLIELVLDENQELPGVEAISLVKYPAIESNFVFFNRQNRPSQLITMGAIDDEKRTLIGPAMIPDKLIPRYDEETGEEYDVYFSADTVKKSAEFFLKQNRTNSHTHEHQTAIENVSVVESWIVEDAEKDKQNLYNLSNPVGTWMVRIHCANENMWQEVKAGNLQGLSIEGYFFDNVQKMSKTKLSERTMIERIYQWFTRRKFYAEVTLGNGDVICTDGDVLEPGVSVYKLDDKGNPVDIPNGTYQTEGGKSFEVYDGIVIEFDGQVAATEAKTPQQPEINEMKVMYLKNLYKQRMKKIKMARHAFTDYAKEATIWLRPLGIDAPDKQFYPFRYGSFQEYADAVQEWLEELGDNMGMPVEEAEPVDWDYIDAEAVSTGYVEGFTESTYDTYLWVLEKAGDLTMDPVELMKAIQEMGWDYDEVENEWERSFQGKMTILQWAEELFENGDIDKSSMSNYFDWEKFGNDLLAGGDVALLIEESGDAALSEEAEGLRGEELATWYLDNAGLEIEDLGDEIFEKYFDLHYYAKDLQQSGDVTQVGTSANPLLFVY